MAHLGLSTCLPACVVHVCCLSRLRATVVVDSVFVDLSFMGCLASIPEDAVGIIESQGQFSRLAFPGVQCVIPLHEELVAIVGLQDRNCSTPLLELNTKEFALVGCKVNVQYRVRDEQSGEIIDSNSNVYKAYYTVKDDLEPKILEYIEGNLRAQIRGHSLAHVVGKSEEIAKLLMEEADAEMEQYGFSVSNVWITDLTSKQDPNAPPPAEESSAVRESGDDLTFNASCSSGGAAEKEMFLDPSVYTALEGFFEQRGLRLVSALPIVKMHRKFGRDPAPRIIVITKSEGQKDGAVKVEMHNLKRTEKDEGKGKGKGFMHKSSPKGYDEEEDDAHLQDDTGEYKLIRTYPLMRLKDIKVEDGMFVLTFDGKTPDLCISSQNARQVNCFMAEAIQVCSECAVTATAGDSPGKEKGHDDSGYVELMPAGDSPKTPATGGGMFGGTKSVLNKNKEKLMENKEKLGRMSEQSSEMAAQAADFLEAVKRLQKANQGK